MKKKNFILTYLLFILIALCTNLRGQFNIQTNSYDQIQELETPQTNFKNSVSISSITCNPNGFFGVRSNGIVEEFSLNGNIVTFTTVATSTPAITSLAYCNNVSLSSSDKTFYSSNNSFNNPIYYDPTVPTWINASQTYSSALNNCGGNGNNLYYTSRFTNSVYSRKIVKYDGTAFTEIYSRINRLITVADLAVDDGGNVWFLTGTDSLSFVCDSIMEISPTGEILKQLPFSYNCYNAYGSFILNNVFYIGFGSSNSISPNKLLPLTFINNIANTGNFINMPANNYTDLASCNAGYPVGLKDHSSKDFQNIRIFPNPAYDILNIDVAILNGNSSKLKILNSLGQIVREEKIQNSKSQINVSQLPIGIYYLKIQNDTQTITRKIIKQ